MHASLIAALRPRGTKPVKVLELGSPVSARYSTEGFRSSGGGAYRGWVVDWGSPGSAWSDRSYGLETPTTVVTVKDNDRSIEAFLSSERSTGAFIEGSPATIKIGHPSVDYANWYPVFGGVLSGIEFGSVQKEYGLVFRRPDLALRRNIPRPEWKLGNDWPNTPAELFQQICPFRFGKHDSSARGGGGAVRLFQVDENVWVWTGGIGKSVYRVYDSGELLSSGWTATTATRNNRSYSIVTLDLPPTGEVTADVEGLTDNGNGGGTTILSPIDQLSYVLSQLIFQSYQSGAWLATSSYISSTSFTSAKTFLAKLANGGHEGSLNLEEVTTGLQLLESIGRSYHLSAVWTDDGKLGFAFEDHTESDYPSSWLKMAETELHGQSSLPMRDSEGLIDRVNLLLPAGLSFDVRDLSAHIGGVPASEDVNRLHSRAYL